MDRKKKNWGLGPTATIVGQYVGGSPSWRVEFWGGRGSARCQLLEEMEVDENRLLDGVGGSWFKRVASVVGWQEKQQSWREGLFGEIVEAVSIENATGEMAGFLQGGYGRGPPLLASVGLERAFQIPHEESPVGCGRAA